MYLVKQEIEKLTKNLEEGFNTNDLDKMMEFYTDSYVDVNLPNPIQTKAERREYYRNVINTGGFKLKVILADVIVTGNHAIARGDIQLLFNDPTKNKTLRYIEIWEKQDGSWRSIWGMDAELHN